MGFTTPSDEIVQLTAMVGGGLLAKSANDARRMRPNAHTRTLQAPGLSSNGENISDASQECVHNKGYYFICTTNF